MMHPVFKNIVGLTVLSLGACGAVEVPEERYYRLALPEVPAAPGAEQKPRELGVLRVRSLELAATLDGDRIMVAESPVRLRALEFHRWVAPLPRMLQDELITGLRRSGAFTEVKSELDPSGEDLRLSGRVLDCHQVAGEGQWTALLRLELRLERAGDGRTLFRDEFVSRVPLQDGGQDGLVEGLSRGLQEVLQAFVQRSAAHRTAAQARPPK